MSADHLEAIAHRRAAEEIHFKQPPLLTQERVLYTLVVIGVCVLSAAPFIVGLVLLPRP